ncbi:MAG TPA: cyclic dehypoxanthinyl futalosine synthase [Thermoanaerobaculia bacterium]|nr:cyclic dehypoxanthinyl futalosine synthase [Thermoanaerobaculia bacterium]
MGAAAPAVSAEVLPAPPAPGLGGSPRVVEILERASSGERIDRDDALVLFEEATLLELGAAAMAVRNRLRDPRVVTYQIDRNINYTNVCVYRCTFCAFYRPAGHDEGYVLSFDEIAKKVEETLALGGTGVLLQGGVHAELPFTFYEELLSFLRERFPAIHRHCFSAPEIYFLAKKEKTSIAVVLERLKAAGLMSVPGGGAEILDDAVRRRIFALTKAPVAKWVEVHREAHRLGLPTTATMMFGVGEGYASRVDHLDVVRSAQDASLRERVESFTAFIPWTFQEENTALDGTVETSGGYDYLRTLAIARLYLDNVPHVQGSWLTQGTKIGQVSLLFGADDLGSIMIEENVVAAAGSHNRTSEAEIRRLIAEAGYVPRQRGSVYDRCGAPCCARLNAAPDARG